MNDPPFARHATASGRVPRAAFLVALALAAGTAGAFVGIRAGRSGGPAAAAPQLCGKPIPAAVVVPLQAPMLASAPGYDATLTIRPHAGTPACRILHGGAHLVLGVGQRVQFVATMLPTLVGGGAVQVTSGPGPYLPNPGGGPLRHLVVTLTARRPGAVEVAWAVCSDAAC